MTAGISTANVANIWLGFWRGTTITSPAAVYVKLHIGDPGATGVANAATGSTTRPAILWSAPASGTLTITGTNPSWTNGGASETLSHVSLWDSATVGNFLSSVVLTSSKTWASGDTFTLTSYGWALTPLAA